MNNQATQEKLTQMRLWGMQRAFRGVLEGGIGAKYTADELIGHLVDADWDERHNRRLARLLKGARFRYQASFEQIDFRRARNLDKNLVLRLSDGSWVQEHRNVIVTGPTGVGKSFLCSAIGHQACLHGFKTRYFNCTKFFPQTRLWVADGSYLKQIDQIARTDVVIFDDFGLQHLDGPARLTLLEVLEDRVGRRSTGPVHRGPPWSPPTSGSPVRSPPAPTDIVQGAPAGSNQVCLLLRLDCLKIAELAGSQHRHERLHLPPDGAVPLADRQFLAGKVHEQLVADLVLDMHRHLVAVTPHLKVVAELRVAVPVRLFLAVLLPDLLDRHPDPLQFPCAALKPSAQRTVASVCCPTPGKQLHELAVADSLDLRVAEPGRRKVPCVLAHHRMRYPQGTTDLSIAEPFFPQTNNVSDLAHADPLVGHGFSFPAAAGNQKPAR